jgi:dihydroorotate dehydrogenase (fumarate)
MDLATRYMGLLLNNPIIASASPQNAMIETIQQLEEAGAAAVVLPSIFEEQISADSHRIERLMAAGSDSFPEASSFFPVQSLRTSADPYLELIRLAADQVEIPIIASLNGVSEEGWISYARAIEQAGAKGLELNIYFIPTDLGMSGEAVEQRYVDIVKAVRQEISIPLAVKLGPYFSSMGAMAGKLVKAGADALVLFNRFYQPDIDLHTLRLVKNLHLSSPQEIRLPLLWISVLHGNIAASIAASTGVETAEQVIKYLLAGADAVMTTSALLRNGPGHVATLLEGLEDWMEARNLQSLDQLRGILSRKHVGVQASIFERANYLEIIEGYPAGPA